MLPRPILTAIICYVIIVISPEGNWINILYLTPVSLCMLFTEKSICCMDAQLARQPSVNCSHNNSRNPYAKWKYAINYAVCNKIHNLRLATNSQIHPPKHLVSANHLHKECISRREWVFGTRDESTWEIFRQYLTSDNSFQANQNSETWTAWWPTCFAIRIYTELNNQYIINVWRSLWEAFHRHLH